MDAIAHGTPHQQPAVGGYVIAERQLRQVAAVERDNEAPQEAAEDDAARTLVGRQVVGLALRVVEFLLLRLYVHVGIGQLAEIDLWARHG